MNNKRTKKYLDQFVRIKYLYNIIEKSNIKYDYIIRARIDQYIDYNIFENIFNGLNKSKITYPIITNHCLDNFFIIGNNHFNFFNFIVDNIGSENLSYENTNNYILGPEVQFNLLCKSYFNSIKSFDHFNIYFEVAFCFCDNNNIFFYSSKNCGYIPFTQYMNINKINNENYLEKLKNDKNFKCEKNINIIKKYNENKYLIMFYSILLNNFV